MSCKTCGNNNRIVCNKGNCKDCHDNEWLT